MTELLFHPEADNEYLEAFQWYEVRSAHTASRFEAEVDEVLGRIASSPESFHRYDAIHRFAIVNRFPYSIVYRPISGEQHHVIAVAHSSRSPGYWQHRT